MMAHKQLVNSIIILAGFVVHQVQVEPKVTRKLIKCKWDRIGHRSAIIDTLLSYGSH